MASSKTPAAYKAVLILIVGSLLTAGFTWLISSSSFLELDERLLVLFRHASDLANPLGPAAIEEAIRDLTSLGGTLVTTLISVCAVIVLVILRQPRQAVFLALAVLLGVGYVFLIKAGFDRPRPDIVPHAMRSLSASFPSAHAAVSAIVYFLLADMVSRGSSSRPLKAFTLGVAALITLSVGISRVYLGVHWPTDVIGGWIIGFTWVWFCWLIEEALIAKRVLKESFNGDADRLSSQDRDPQS